MWLETHVYQQIPLLFIIIINLFITFFKKHCKKFVYLKFIVNFILSITTKRSLHPVFPLPPRRIK